MKHVFSLILICTFSHFTFQLSAQCTNGILMTNCGGCEGACNLTSFGGPNCTAIGSPTGNCSSVQNLSANIVVPAGCSYTVSATITPRPGCGNGSGADNGDQVKVDISSGSKAFINGSGNGTITDSYTLTGPGTIVVSAKANRRDEITTYTISSTGANGSTCTNCISTLPIELISFDAEVQGRSIALTWVTNSEKNNDYFTLEKSNNGIDFDKFYTVSGMGSTTVKANYHLLDVFPFEGISYYRLKQTDTNGETKIISIKAVNLDELDDFLVFPNPASDKIYISDSDFRKESSSIELFNAMGQLVSIELNIQNGINQLDVSKLLKGNYILKLINKNNVKTEKIVII